MWGLYQCVTTEHDLRLVLLAAAICVLGVYTAFGLALRVLPASTARLRAYWLIAAAGVTGLGTWATHFVAMLAYDGGVRLSYDAGLTLLSVVVAVAVSGVGFFVALIGNMPLIGGAVVGLSIAAMHYVGIAAIEAPAALIWDVRYVAASVAAASNSNSLGPTISAPVASSAASIAASFSSAKGTSNVGRPSGKIPSFMAYASS